MPKSKRKKRSRFIKKKEDDAVKLIMRKSKLGSALTDFNNFLMTILHELQSANKAVFDNIEREDLTPYQEREIYLEIQKAAAAYLLTHMSQSISATRQDNSTVILKKFSKSYKNVLIKAFQNFRDPNEFPIQLIGSNSQKDKNYSNFLNTVFQLARGEKPRNTRTYKDSTWRNIYEPIGAGQQCFEVLKQFHDERTDGERKQDYIERVKIQEESGQRKENWFAETGLPAEYEQIFAPGRCYICRSMLTLHHEDDPLQCEHILPMFSALSHAWFHQGPESLTFLSDEEKTKMFQQLVLEYEWSHKCCNQKKSNFPFILFQKGKCQFNNKVAHDLLQTISEKSYYGDGQCGRNPRYRRLQSDAMNIDNSTGLGYEKTIKRLGRRVQPLIEIINENMDINFSSIPLPQAPPDLKAEIAAAVKMDHNNERELYLEAIRANPKYKQWTQNKRVWKRKWSTVYFSSFTRMNIYIAWSKLRALSNLGDYQFRSLIHDSRWRFGDFLGGGGLRQPDKNFEDEIFINMVLTFGIPSLNIEPYMIGFTNDSEMLVKGYGTSNTFLNISTSINKNRFHSYILSLRPLRDNIETVTEEEKQKILYEVANKPEILSQTPDMSLSSDPMEISSSKNNSLDLGSYPLSENIYNNSNIQSTPDDYLTKTIKQSPFTTTPSTRRRSPHSTSQRISRVHGGKKKKKRTRKKRRKRKKKTRRKKA